MAREHSVQDSKHEVVYIGCMLSQGEACDLQLCRVVTVRIRDEQFLLVFTSFSAACKTNKKYLREHVPLYTESARNASCMHAAC